jgi:hypothetical protein
MGTTTTTKRLAAYERRYRELADELARTGYIRSGSLVRRYTTCGTPGCRCHDDPPQRHGPYFQWSAKIAGKTVTRRLNDAEAALYKEWVTNDRRVRVILAEMHQIAEQAGELMLAELATERS